MSGTPVGLFPARQAASTAFDWQLAVLGLLEFKRGELFTRGPETRGPFCNTLVNIGTFDIAFSGPRQRTGKSPDFARK